GGNNPEGHCFACSIAIAVFLTVAHVIRAAHDSSSSPAFRGITLRSMISSTISAIMVTVSIVRNKDKDVLETVKVLFAT
ncbi:unnamed protein product, partial [Cylicocyclus nassatus]